MVTDKKNLPGLRIMDYGGNVTKPWYIEFYDGDKRIKKTKGINQHNTKEARTQAAQVLIAIWEQKLHGKLDGAKGTAYEKQYKAITRYTAAKSYTWRAAEQIKARVEKFLLWNDRQTITKDRIESFLDHLGGKGLKKNTIASYFSSIRTILGAAIGTDLFKGISCRKESGTPARYFSNGQVKFLSKNIAEKDPMLWFAIQLIFYCFIRPKELRLLKVGDVVIEESKICIMSSVSKNKKTQYVIIPQVFIDELDRALVGRDPGEYLIVNSRGKQIGKNSLKTSHQRLLKEFNFDTVNHKLYSWKHTGAVAAVRAGIHIKQLQMQLRHHSLDQVNAYLRQLGIMDLEDFSSKMPKI